MAEIFKAHCSNGINRLPHIKIVGEDEAIRYVILKKETYAEIILEDSRGCTVMKVENHEIVFPEKS
ncbi:hypothetical protein J2Z48_001781 [Croceifilum oryzae]|uniref:Uncharacterized protein n=1 Tax=Croceifilum oryzae TaxID=1553429 RepID=A0AAJ1WSP8_9BACL|nr:hypothetical protein [Croceifilum oryzae]MDQ0417608.1 hypothetical protein [Croceifilum oryzae]